MENIFDNKRYFFFLQDDFLDNLKSASSEITNSLKKYCENNKVVRFSDNNIQNFFTFFKKALVNFDNIIYNNIFINQLFTIAINNDFDALISLYNYTIIPSKNTLKVFNHVLQSYQCLLELINLYLFETTYEIFHNHQIYTRLYFFDQPQVKRKYLEDFISFIKKFDLIDFSELTNLKTFIESWK